MSRATSSALQRALDQLEDAHARQDPRATYIAVTLIIATRHRDIAIQKGEVVGLEFGAWTVTGPLYSDGAHRMAPCACTCGFTAKIRIDYLTGERTHGCVSCRNGFAGKRARMRAASTTFARNGFGKFIKRRAA